MLRKPEIKIALLKVTWTLCYMKLLLLNYFEQCMYPNPHTYYIHVVVPVYLSYDVVMHLFIGSKIEKVPRGIQWLFKTKKYSVSSGKLVSTIGAYASHKKDDGTRCPEG